MADIVFGLGTSHTPMLNASARDWLTGFVELDPKRAHRDKSGHPIAYNDLLRIADARAAPALEKSSVDERHARSQAGLAKLKAALLAAKLDALIVIGDDQNELFGADNLPAVLVYRGASIPNTPRMRGNTTLPPWYAAAMSAFYDDPKRDYPVAADLANHIVESLTADDFDVATSAKVTGEHGEGHAFAFIHRRLMSDAPIPVVPIFLNAYYPPNQPTPKRCHALGQAIRRAVQAFPADARVGVAASGGLSHFTVDEDLDREVLRALEAKDAAALTALPVRKLQGGSSEIRNWICAAGALEGLELAWSDYIPGYRTLAGTGTGIGFALWG